MNVKELTHSQQQSQAPKTHKKVSTGRLTTRITMLWAPQRSLLCRLKDSMEVKCKKHTQQSTSSRESLRPVNLTENVRKTLSKAPCLVAKRMSLTLHLLLFKQSMCVLIVIVFMYLILMKGKIYTK